MGLLVRLRSPAVRRRCIGSQAWARALAPALVWCEARDRRSAANPSDNRIHPISGPDGTYSFAERLLVDRLERRPPSA
jgi:hypothetical protein